MKRPESRLTTRSLLGGLALLALVFAPGRAKKANAKASPSRSGQLLSLSVGYNRSHDPQVANLRYADDDALRNTRLMQNLGAQTVTLTEKDAPTLSLFPKMNAGPPTLEAVEAAIRKLNGRAADARRRGQRVSFYLFYTGHGNVQRGEGYVQLRDGRLTRGRLRRLLRQIRADQIHVIIDACKSYFAVFERGGRRRRKVARFLPKQVSLPKRTGFILSTSSASDSHEWEAFQAGVFSHEIRSGLRGAADLNRDQRVTYEELAAFVHAANRSVPNWRYRPQFFIQPPGRTAAREASVVDLRGAIGRRLLFDGKPSHYYVETAAGVRLADLHPGSLQVTLIVPSDDTIYVRQRHSSLEYRLPAKSATPMTTPAKKHIALSQLTVGRPSSRVRGAEHVAFQRLFARPFTTASVAIYRNRPVATIDDRAVTDTASWLRPTLGWSGLAVLAAGGVLTGLAASERGTADEHTPAAERATINGRIERFNQGAVVCYALGASAVVGYLLWKLWPRKKIQIEVAAGARSSGLSLKARW